MEIEVKSACLNTITKVQNDWTLKADSSFSAVFSLYFCFPSLHQDLDKVSFLLAISQTDFGKSLVKPRIKVGREFVNQGRNLQQVLTCLLLKCFSLRAKPLFKLCRFKYYSYQLMGCIPFCKSKNNLQQCYSCSI